MGRFASDEPVRHKILDLTEIFRFSATLERACVSYRADPTCTPPSLNDPARPTPHLSGWKETPPPRARPRVSHTPRFRPPQPAMTRHVYSPPLLLPTR